MTEPDALQQVNRTFVRSARRTLSYFSGCDYFRLASDPRVLRATRDGLRRFGLNVAASRLTTGNHRIYAELERALAKFFDVEQALLVPNGYATNLNVAQSLAGSFSHALVDAKSHPSLKDAAELLGCPVLEFEHRNPGAAGRAARRCGPGTRLILLTDGLFSHDGSVAPLRAYLELLPKDALLLVDDAHGAGVLGTAGRGTPEFERIPRKRVIQTITLSKAFGVYGGVILCTKRLRTRILEKSRMFVGSTPLPLPLVNAALRSLAILRTDRRMRARLWRNVSFIKEALKRNSKLRELARGSLETPGPMFSVVPQSVKEGRRLQKQLMAAGIFGSMTRYPSGSAEGYFRFVISSEHTVLQLESLRSVLLR